MSGEYPDFVSDEVVICVDHDGFVFLTTGVASPRIRAIAAFADGVIAYLDATGLHAIDEGGAPLWSRPDVVSIVLAPNGRLVASHQDGSLRVLDSAGNTYSHAAARGPFHRMIALEDGSVVGQQGPYTVARVASDGSRIWTGTISGGDGIGGLAVAGDLVWVAVELPEPRGSGYTALHLDDGTRARWDSLSTEGNCFELVAIDGEVVAIGDRQSHSWLRSLSGPPWALTFGASGETSAHDIVVSGERIYLVGSSFGHGGGILDFDSGSGPVGFIAIFER